MTDLTQKVKFFETVYQGRFRASLEDAERETQAVILAIERITMEAKNSSDAATQDLAAGKLFEIANELGSAELAYRRAIELDPDLTEAAVRLVAVLGKQRRISEARELAEALYAKSPNAIVSSLVYSGPLTVAALLGDLYRLSQDYLTAATYYRQAASLDGGSPYAVNQAITAMVASGESQELTEFMAAHGDSYLTEGASSLFRLATSDEEQLPSIRLALSSSMVAAGMEAMNI